MSEFEVWGEKLFVLVNRLKTVSLKMIVSNTFGSVVIFLIICVCTLFTNIYSLSKRLLVHQNLNHSLYTKNCKPKNATI